MDRESVLSTSTCTKWNEEAGIDPTAQTQFRDVYEDFEPSNTELVRDDDGGEDYERLHNMHYQS